VSDLLICVRVFLDVSDLLIFDSCVAVSGFVYPRFGAQAVNIKTIVISSTLRGTLGVGGQNSRPLSALVKGDLIGDSFNFTIEFNPSDTVAFVTAFFKK
jgi:hypothetical protein